ncbi:hypothetical protein V2J09_005429 [Rumex salicifolius]
MAAAGNLGVPHLKVLNPEFRRAHSFCLQSSQGIKTWVQPKAKKYSGIALPCRLKRSMAVFCGPAVSTESLTNSEVASEEKKSSELPSGLIPNARDVEYLVSELCETTSVAEFELKLNGFHLHVTRSLAESPPPAPPSASFSEEATIEAPAQNGSVMSTSLALVKPESYDKKGDKFLDIAADEGLVLVISPKVGFFRRSRMMKKKRAPPPCKEGQIVKEGQTLCFIDQLGGQFAVEATVAGEVVRFLLEDDDPVGYGDPVVAILPSFPGIKKLNLSA